MKSKSYWAERFNLLEQNLYNQGAAYFDRVSRSYDASIRDLEKELAGWYSRYATENGITYAEAKKQLTKGELAAFKMDVEEYIEKGRSLDPAWREQLEKASVRFHVSRLEAMKIRMQQNAEYLAGETKDAIDDMAHKVYSEKYYHTLYEIQRGAGVGFDVSELSERKIKAAIGKTWASDGKHFSTRIWEDKKKLIGELDNAFTQGVIRGTAPKKVIAEISKRMGVKKSNVARLILTENKALQSRAELDGYKELGLTLYEILATLDTRTSPTCREMDGKRFKVSEFEPGLTAPPFHPYCRTCTIPYDEDVDAVFGSGEERAARDNEGKYYRVPAKIKYKEWYAAFVGGGDKTAFTLVSAVEAVNSLLPVLENSDLFKKYGQENYLAMHNTLLEYGNDDMIKVWAKYENELNIVNTNYRDNANFNSLLGGIRLDLSEDVAGSSWQKPFQVSFHELGHHLDWLLGGKNNYSYYSSVYKNGVFEATIRREIDDKVNALIKVMRAEIKKAGNDAREVLLKRGVIDELDAKYRIKFKAEYFKWSKEYAYKAFEKELKGIEALKRSALSDIVEGATNAKVSAGFGHGKKYWKVRPEGVAREAFAEMWECVANPEQWEVLKKYLPEATTIFEEMIKEALK